MNAVDETNTESDNDGDTLEPEWGDPFGEAEQQSEQAIGDNQSDQMPPSQCSRNTIRYIYCVQ